MYDTPYQIMPLSQSCLIAANNIAIKKHSLSRQSLPCDANNFTKKQGMILPLPKRIPKQTV